MVSDMESLYTGLFFIVILLGSIVIYRYERFSNMK
jgi:hypothetical protein